MASERPSGDAVTDIDVPSDTVTSLAGGVRSAAPPAFVWPAVRVVIGSSANAISSAQMPPTTVNPCARRTLKPEPDAELGNPRGNDVRDVAERRARGEGSRQRRVGVEQIVEVEIDAETAAAAEPQLLGGTDAEQVLRGQFPCAEGLEPEGDGTELRDRRSAIGIDLSEQ